MEQRAGLVGPALFLLGGTMSRIFSLLGKFALFLCTSLLIARGVDVVVNYTLLKIDEAKAAIYEALPAKIIKEEREPLPLTEAIRQAAEAHDIDPLILIVISEKESAGGNSRALYRFEPELYSRLRGERAYRNLSDSEVRMLASSHGVFHILGATAESQCQIHFSRLYDQEIAAHCAARIVKNIQGKAQGRATSDQLREIFKRYNGSGKAADVYASDAMSRLAALLYQRQRF